MRFVCLFLILLCCGCSTAIHEVVGVERDELYYYVRWTDVDYYCYHCKGKGFYRDSAITKGYFNTIQYNYYYCGRSHAWLQVEQYEGGELIESVIVIR